MTAMNITVKEILTGNITRTHNRVDGPTGFPPHLSSFATRLQKTV